MNLKKYILKSEINIEISSDFCGLLRKPELRSKLSRKPPTTYLPYGVLCLLLDSRYVGPLTVEIAMKQDYLIDIRCAYLGCINFQRSKYFKTNNQFDVVSLN